MCIRDRRCSARTSSSDCPRRVGALLRTRALPECPSPAGPPLVHDGSRPCGPGRASKAFRLPTSTTRGESPPFGFFLFLRGRLTRSGLGEAPLGEQESYHLG